MNSRERKRVLDWDAQLDLLNYEQILNVSVEATTEDCRLAYYQFAQCFHPDVHPTADREVRDALCRVFQRGSEAYRVLSHPTLRTLWAKVRTQGVLRLSDLAPPPTVDLNCELPNLHVQCRSAGAKLAARQAAISFAQGDVAGATQHLERALEFEGGASLDLARCLEAIRDVRISG